MAGVKKEKIKIAIIGGGAAGVFGALKIKSLCPDADVVVFEKSQKLLSKVKVSGGGRCNVTHHCFEISQLLKNYPRGEKDLRQAFNQFSCADTIEWFELRGVSIKTEADGRMFPTTDNSQTIIDCLMQEADDLQVDFSMGTAIKEIFPVESKIRLVFQDHQEIDFDAVLIAAGGHPTLSGFNWLSKLPHSVVSPVPSLFTFNLKDKSITKLMGVSVPNAQAKIVGSKNVQSGPLLITHWGFSGPAILKLSSFAAKELADLNYSFKVSINWINQKEDEVRDFFDKLKAQYPKRTVYRCNELEIPKRLWEYLLDRIKLDGEIVLGQLSKDHLNRLINTIINDQYDVSGKTTFKEEFVTCGGVSLKEVDFKTMESKIIPNVFFAGEILDVDAVTGGFNFQAAWTTGFIAGKTIGSRFALKKN